MPVFENLLSLILSEFEKQQEEFLEEVIASSLRMEEWKPVSEDFKYITVLELSIIILYRHSISIEELFLSLQRLLPTIFNFSVNVAAEIREFFLGTMIGCINRIVQRYVTSVMEACGNRVRIFANCFFL